MTLDYDSHPSELVEGGSVEGTKKNITVGDLRKAIPAHCFKIDWFTGLFYLFRDCLLAYGLGKLAWSYIPLIRYHNRLEFEVARYAAWLTYGYIQGLVFTGIWVQGHEAGHGVFSPSQKFNDFMGFLCHSALLTPYFSWQSTHRRHHIYANNLGKDHNYVPPKEKEYAGYLRLPIGKLDDVQELVEDAPIAVFFRIVMQQLLGFPTYLISNITASDGSLYKKQSDSILGNSHFLPSSTLFRPEEAHLIIASDIGIASMAGLLYYASQFVGFQAVALLYIQPYLWCNHWIVAITYLHHTHPDVPKYDPEAWTFLRGALATIDRNLGWPGKHLLHNIADWHVIHHLFSRIPQYHAEEATKAIIPLLGDAYHTDKKRSFWYGLWESFTRCQWIAPDTAEEKDRAYFYKSGPIAPPESGMKYRGWA